MFDCPPNALLPDFPDDPPYPVFIPRAGVALNLPLIQSLGLSWGLKPDGTYVMTDCGWAKASLHGAVVSTPLPQQV